MSRPRTYRSLRTLVRRLRDDLNNPTKPIHFVLLFAYNRTGKTRLSMEFKESGKRLVSGPLGTESGDAITTESGVAILVDHVVGDTLYFNAFTEDLFTWDNDLDGDSARHLKLNADSKFFNGVRDLALDETIAGYLYRYADFDFDIDYEDWTVTFSIGDESNIKISRGEETIFVWCLFMAICERVLDDHPSYDWVKFIYIDDPISSLDDNNAIQVGCDLAKLVKRAGEREDNVGEPNPLKIVFSSHHALFFNVMCNELRRVKHRKYFLHRPDTEGVYTLRPTEDTPFFHHVATLSELQKAADSGQLYTYHFNALRSVFEKTAGFFGHKNISFCLEGAGYEEAYYNRAVNLLSHGKYSLFDPKEMAEDNKDLFRQILSDFLDRFRFDLPEILESASTSPTT